MAITLFGVGETHSSGGSLVEDGGAHGITPPASMVAGHLVIVDLVVRDTGLTAVPAVSEAGGQTWSDAMGGSTNSGQSMRSKRFWCRFNGTWSATPTFTFGGTAGQSITGLMSVFAPNTAGSTWSLDTGSYNTGSDTDLDATATVSNYATSNDGALAYSVNSNNDNNTVTLDTANSWSSATIGHVNAGGTGISISTLYQIVPSATTIGGYTLNQNAGNDSWRWLTGSFLETPPAGGSTGRMLMLGVG